MDYFNSSEDFKKSLKNKKIFKTFHVRSDNDKFHFQNTKPIKYQNFFDFILKKINIFFSKFISHIFLPIFLTQKKINLDSIYYKLNINFLKFEKIIIFSEEYSNFLKHYFFDKKRKTYLYVKNYKKYKIKNYNWIFAYGSNDKKILTKLLKYLIMLKKLKKITKVHFKGHPTWKHDGIEKKFLKMLDKKGIKYSFLENYKEIDYAKYFGVISTPSTVLLEAKFHKPEIKTIVIKSKSYYSGLLYKFYNSTKGKNIWEPNLKRLKSYIDRKNENKFNPNNLNNILKQLK